MAETSSGQSTAESSGTVDINAPYTPKQPTPVVSISINHPIATAAKKIKNFLIHKQTLFSTSFSIKVTPIVALVSFFGLAAVFGGGVTTAFNFGRAVEQKFLTSLPTPTPKVIITSPTPAPVVVSREGTIKATYQLSPVKAEQHIVTENNGIAMPMIISLSPDMPSLTPIPTLKPPTTPTPQTSHYILVSRNGSILFLNADSSISLQRYINLHVLITGSFDSTKNTLSISKTEDIEILQ